MKKIPDNLFDLTEEEKNISIMLYNKVVKCLIAPHHSFKQLEPFVTYTPKTFLFPERDENMSYTRTRQFISMITNNPDSQDVLIITSSMSIILDMVNVCTRILNEQGEIVYNSHKTFEANIHDIRYKILENDTYRLSKSERNSAQEKINVLIDKINSSKSLSKSEHDELLVKIKLIGEPIISVKLSEMLNRIPIV